MVAKTLGLIAIALLVGCGCPDYRDETRIDAESHCEGCRTDWNGDGATGLDDVHLAAVAFAACEEP